MKKPWQRVLASANLLAVLLFLWVLFIMVNYLSSRHYTRWDLTKQQITKLSDQTLHALKTLKEPLAITVFYQPTNRLFQLIKDELGEYERTSRLIRVDYVDPEQDIAKAKQLAQQFQIDTLNIVVFQSGSRHKYLSDTELAEYDYNTMTFSGEPRVKSFKGEAAFTSAVISVTQAKSPLVWVTTGHGEKAVGTVDPIGLSDLKKSLEQQNMTVQPVTLLERLVIPAEVKLVIIPGPTRRFTEQELALLQGYLQQGGRVLAMIDPLANSGLDSLLERWGILLGMDVVVDPTQRLPFISAANLIVTTYTDHPIVKQMKTLVTLFPLVRSVRPVQPIPKGLTVTPLAMTSKDGWGESNPTDPHFKFDEGKDLKGPVSIAAASERTSPAPTRLVVIGDADFVINAQLANVGNKDFFLGTVYWLIEQEERIGIGPKTLENLKLNLTGSQLTGMFWLSLFALPTCCGLLGVGMWWIRRT